MTSDSSSTPRTGAADALEAWLVEWLARRLGVDPRAIDRGEALNHQGLDSLGATELSAALSRRLERRLSSVLVWEHPTVDELVRHLTGRPATEESVVAEPVARSEEAIAIVGMACRMPGARSPRELWQRLCEGHDAVGDIPAGRWAVEEHYHPDPAHPETMNTRQGAFLDRIDRFDPLFFHISPREAEQMDPQQRLMLELSWEAFEDAGIVPAALAGSTTGVFFGAMWRDYADLHRELRSPTTLHTGPGVALNMIANRVSYALDLQGPSLVVDTACSSTLVAADLACQSLRAGASTLALVGGVSLMISPATMVQMTKYGGLAGDGRCKTCDARADGFGRGEGGGVLVLKPLTRALRDGDRVYGVIRSSAVNNDGLSNGLTAPNPRAQVAVLQKAYRGSGIPPEQVDYVEMHGAGTALGDPIETEALSRVLCARRRAEEPLVVGAVKSNLAHLEAASGAAGLIKTAMAIHRRRIPPNVHFEQCNPNIALEDMKLRIPTEVVDWPRREGRRGRRRARAGVNAFGWGGTNAHLVLEEVPAARPSTLWRARCRAESPSPSGAEDRGRLVFVCSPVGSQWPGMGLDLLAGEPAFRAAWKACDEVYRELSGRSIFDELVQAGDGPRWTEPEFALPATFFVDVAVAALWRSWGVVPDAVCGHSLGEIAAAHLAGALTLRDALRVVDQYARLGTRRRGTGMAIVGLPAGEIEKLGAFGDGLWIAGENSPDNTLVAGADGAVERLLASLESSEVFRSRVRLGAAYHCPLLEPQQGELRQALADLRPRRAEIPLYSTVTGRALEGPELDAEHWARHHAEPVGFAAMVERLLADGHRRFLDLGPHSGLRLVLEECFAASATSGPQPVALGCLRRDRETVETFGEALEQLADRCREPAPSAHLVLLSGQTPDALRDAAAALAARLRETPADGAPELVDLAATTALRRSHYEHRLALAVDSLEQLADGLERWLEGAAVPAASVSRTAVRRAPRTAFVFSGQGPQWWWARGAELMASEPVFAATIERCEAELRRAGGFAALGSSAPGFSSLREAIAGAARPGELQRPAIAQPVLLSIQLGLEALWRSWGLTPAVVFGHSFGEIAAAHAAGVLDLAAAVRVAVERGRVMEKVLGSGTMASLELSAAEAEAICRPYGERLVVASINAPSLVALSGEMAAVKEVVAEQTARGVGCWPLRVKLPFHSPLMEEAGRELEAALAGLEPGPGSCPIVSAVTGEVEAGSEFGASYWRRNVRRPVLFQKAVETAAGMGCEAFVEITTQPLLAGAITQGLEVRGRAASVVSAMVAGRERASMLEALGGLHAGGSEVDWRRLYPEFRPVTLPTYPFQRQRYWLAPAEAPDSPAPLRSAPDAAAAVDPSGNGRAASVQPVAAARAGALRPANGGPESAASAAEEVLDLQLQAFNRLVAEQLATFRGSES